MGQMGQGTAQVNSVAETLHIIKTDMPSTYAAIQAHAAAHGNQAFALVRRALRGEANCFYALEAGHVVGTPFSDRTVTDEVAGLMVRFGVSFLIMWPAQPGEQT